MKIAGVVLVLIFSVGLGGYFSDMEKRKVRLCEEICGFLQYLQEAVSRNVTVDEIIKSYFEKSSSECISAKSRKELFEKLRTQAAGDDCKKLLSETAAFLSELGKEADTAQERERCERMLRKAAKISEKVISESKKKRELYGRLGLILGITVCVVLI